ncbi:MAG TPA: pilus assembly protein TadA [Gammaproteobacteria bacterium]|nr:pilus assembly protein TadA [Gammaproteobacteria bacterium]
MFIFDIVDAQDNRTRYQLDMGTYSLGKADKCDVLLNDPYSSKKHALLHVDEDSVFIEDLKSTNGTWVNSHKVDRRTAIYEDDSIKLGGLRLIVVEMIKPKSTDFQSSIFNEEVETAPEGHGESQELVELKRHIHGLILEYLDRRRANLHGMSAQELRTEAQNATTDVIQKHIKRIPPEITEAQLIKEVVAETVGLGALEPLLADADVSEIMVNGSDRIYVERNGLIKLTGHRFSSDQSLLGVIDRIVAPIGRRIDESSPMVDARLADGSRINAIIPPLSLTGPTLTIRKFTGVDLNMKDLVAKHTLSSNMAKFLEICVRLKKNLVISGGTGSGKTTSLNVLSSFIGHQERIVTIEDAAELKLQQPHVVSLESRPSNAEGKGLITIRDLVVNSLRMRPDRIIVGECRSGEALDMLQAMNTGHDGSMTTGHANSPHDFLARLEVMVLMAGMELPIRAIREQMASAIDIIVQQDRLSDGSRKITQISELVALEGENISLQPIFEFKRTAITETGQVKGEFRATGHVPKFYDEAVEAGVNLDRTLFFDGATETVEPINREAWTS